MEESTFFNQEKLLQQSISTTAKKVVKLTYQKVKLFTKYIISNAINIAVLMLTVLIASILFAIISKEKHYVIQEFEVSEKIVSKGISESHLKLSFLGRMEEIYKKVPRYKGMGVKSTNQLREISQLKIEIQGVGISIDVIENYIAEFLGKENFVIRGKLFNNQNKNYLSVEVSMPEPKLILREVKDLKNLDAAVKLAVVDLIKHTDPPLMGIYLAEALDLRNLTTDKKLLVEREIFDLVRLMLTNEKEEDDIDAYFVQAYYLYKIEKKEEAVRSIELAYRLDKDLKYPNILVNWGLYLKDLEKYALAEQKYQEALRIDDRNIPAMVGLLYLSVKTDDTIKASKWFKRIVQLDPGNKDAYFELGYMYFNHRKFKRAAKYYEIAVAVDVSNYDACSNLGFSYSNRGRFDDAANAYRMALRIKPSIKDSINLGDCYLALKQYTNAKEIYQNALRCKSTSCSQQSELKFRLAKSYSKLGQYKLADSLFIECDIGNIINKYHLLIAWGNALYDAGTQSFWKRDKNARNNISKADSLYLKALSADQCSNSSPLIGLASTSLYLGNYFMANHYLNRAAILLRRKIAFEKDEIVQSRYNYLLGTLYNRFNFSQQADSLFQQARKMNPRIVEINWDESFIPCEGSDFKFEDAMPLFLVNNRKFSAFNKISFLK